jgi:hypothetical protein
LIHISKLGRASASIGSRTCSPGDELSVPVDDIDQNASSLRSSATTVTAADPDRQRLRASERQAARTARTVRGRGGSGSGRETACSRRSGRARREQFGDLGRPRKPQPAVAVATAAATGVVRVTAAAAVAAPQRRPAIERRRRTPNAAGVGLRVVTNPSHARR